MPARGGAVLGFRFITKSVGSTATEENVEDVTLLVLTTYPSRSDPDSTNIQPMKGNIFFFSAQALLGNNVQQQLCAETNRRKGRTWCSASLHEKTACAQLSS